MPRGTKEEPSDFTIAVQEELKRLQELKGWSQRELEKRSGVRQTRITRTLGTNAKSLDLTELEKLCNALGISPELLIATTEEKLRQADYALAANTSTEQKGEPDPFE